METFGAMFGIVLLFALLLIPGFLLGRLGLIEKSAMLSFGNILMYVAMPFLVFSKLLEIDLKTVSWELMGISGLLPIPLTWLLFFLSKLLFPGTEGRKRAMRFCGIFPNCGFLGIPLAGAMWPDQPQIVLYISVFNVVSTFLLLTLGVYVLSGDKVEIRLKKCLFSPIAFAIVLGLLCAYFDVAAKIPGLVTYGSTLAGLTTPMAMISLGMELSGLHPVRMWQNKGVYAVAFVKLLAAPLLALLLLLAMKYMLFMNLEDRIIYAIMVSTAVSTAASAPTMAQKYGADAEYAASLTLINTLLCVLTLPIVYMLYQLILLP